MAIQDNTESVLEDEFEPVAIQPVDHQKAELYSPSQPTQPTPLDLQPQTAPLDLQPQVEHVPSSVEPETYERRPAETYERLPSNTIANSDNQLPVIFNQLDGNSEIQTPPTVIRMSGMFGDDTRVTSNPMYHQMAAQPSEPRQVTPYRSVYESTPSLPNQEPYRIRTTSRPGSGGDFVPAR